MVSLILENSCFIRCEKILWKISLNIFILYYVTDIIIEIKILRIKQLIIFSGVGSDFYVPIQRSRSHGHGERDHRHHHHHHRDPRESQRYKVARELLDTEKKYCKTLWTIQDIFADPLKKANILSHKDIT